MNKISNECRIGVKIKKMKTSITLVSDKRNPEILS